MRSVASFVLWAVLFVCATTTPAYSQDTSTEVAIPSVPLSIEEFVELRDGIAETPEGGAAVFALAVYLYTLDRDLGMSAITVALDRSRLIEDQSGYKGYKPASTIQMYLRDYTGPKPYIARSYFLGTSPENRYEIPSGPLSLRISKNSYSGQQNGQVKVFVECTGADSPRPVILAQNNRGLWKATNVNSLFVGIRKPIEEIDDDL